MPVDGEILFRNSATGMSFNAPGTASGLRLTAAVRLAEDAIGGWHAAYQWVDFAYSWMQPRDAFGDQSFWRRDGAALWLNEGFYHINLSVMMQNDKSLLYWFQPGANQDWTTWTRLGTSRGIGNTEQGIDCWFAVPAGGGRVVAQTANGRSSSGSNQEAECTSWTAQIMKYAATNVGANPDQVLARLQGATQWTNESSEVTLGGMNGISKHEQDSVIYSPGTYALWITGLDYVLIDNATFQTDDFSMLMASPGLYEVRCTFTGENTFKRCHWDIFGSGRPKSKVSEMGGYTDPGRNMSVIAIVNLPATGNLTDLVELQFKIDDDLSSNMYYSARNYSIVRLGPPL